MVRKLLEILLLVIFEKRNRKFFEIPGAKSEWNGNQCRFRPIFVEAFVMFAISLSNQRTVRFVMLESEAKKSATRNSKISGQQLEYFLDC